MKIDTLTKWTRKSILLVMGACIVVLATGCPWDDDEDNIPAVPYVWDISWTNDDSGVSPLTIPLQYGDLNEITSYMESYGDYTVSITRDGNSVTVEVWDWTGGSFSFYATGTITSATAANGNYTGTSSSGKPIQGTWMVVRQ